MHEYWCLKIKTIENVLDLYRLIEFTPIYGPLVSLISLQFNMAWVQIQPGPSFITVYQAIEFHMSTDFWTSYLIGLPVLSAC